MKKTLSILVPLYNEEESFPFLIDRLHQLIKQIKDVNIKVLLVDDGSQDNTLELIKKTVKKNPAFDFISLSRNFGKEAAMKAGLDLIEGDAVVIIDADLQDPPELIPEMIKLWQEGYDDIYAQRKSREGESFFKRFSSNQYYRVLQATTDIQIQQRTGDFRLLDKKCIDALRAMPEHDRNTKALFSWIGFKKKALLYDRAPRVAGETKWSYPKLIKLAVDGIISFTTAPLRWIGMIGGIIALGALIYIIVIIVRTIMFGSDVDGYPSLMSVILLMGGVQLLGISVLGEYIGRIFNETKNRPVYLIQETSLEQDR